MPDKRDICRNSAARQVMCSLNALIPSPATEAECVARALRQGTFTAEPRAPCLVVSFRERFFPVCNQDALSKFNSLSYLIAGS